MRLHVSLLLLAALAACNESGNVLTTVRSSDAGTTDAAADASTQVDATAPDAAPDAGPPDAAAPDAEPQLEEWTRLPGLHGGAFRHAGATGDDAFLLGRRLDESAFSVYRVDETGAAQKLGYPLDGRGAPLFPPIGTIAEVGGRLYWATESDGIAGSGDGGETWAFENIGWEDGSVGMGNGHVSRILDGWIAGAAFCLHREVTPWVNYRVVDEDRYNEVRCLESGTWSVVTSSIAEGVRFFHAHGRDLHGFTAPLYNMQTGDPKFCHSGDLGVTWTCRSTELHEGFISHTESGRVVVARYVDSAAVPPATETQLWYTDDHGQSWTLGATVPAALTVSTAVGETIYGVTYALDVVLGPLYAIDLDAGTYETRAAPTRAHSIWLELYAQAGQLFEADTRGLRRYDAAADRWLDVAVEPMPALDVALDPSGNVWAIDGSRAARRLRNGDTQWEEHFFDDTGWGQADILDHARVYTLAQLEDRLYFGTAHRKLYAVSTGDPVVIPQEDQTLVSLVHPDAVLWRMTAHGDDLFIAATGGEEVNHGNGSRLPWGGGLYQRTRSGTWTDLSTGLPPRVVGGVGGRPIIGAVHADDAVVLAATEAGVYRSDNHGQTWRAAGNLPAFDATEDATFIARGGAGILLARVASGRTTLYLSTNEGTSFTAIGSDLPAGTTRDLTADGGAFFALVDPLGVFRSDDGARTWTPAGTVREGVFPAKTYALEVTPSQLLVGTADGVWKLDR